ncbi:MAG: hypothetical protein ACLP5E_11090 [Streptosporangiaceae bacterium]
MGGLFGGRVGGLGGFCAGLEGIDLRHQPSAGRSNTLFFGLHVGVLAAQVPGRTPTGFGVRALDAMVLVLAVPITVGDVHRR